MKGTGQLIGSLRGVLLNVACGLLASVVALGSGCVMVPTPSKETLADGSFRLKCTTSLPRCLDSAEEICHGTRYRVVSAEDNHVYTGPHGWEGEARTSEAVVRCGTRGVRLWGEDESAAATQGGAATAGAALPGMAGGDTSKVPGAAGATGPGTATGAPAICVPGSTQACVGAGACQGGQFCLPDGAGFSPCDCGRGDDKDAAGGGRTPP